MGPYGVQGSLSMGPYGVPGSRDSWTRGLGSRDSGTGDLGSRDSGIRDLGSRDLGTRVLHEGLRYLEGFQLPSKLPARRSRSSCYAGSSAGPAVRYPLGTTTCFWPFSQFFSQSFFPDLFINFLYKPYLFQCFPLFFFKCFISFRIGTDPQNEIHKWN